MIDFFKEHLSLATFVLWMLKVFKNSFFIEHLQKQSFAHVLQNRRSQKFWKLHRKAPELESLFKKLAGWMLATLLKSLQHSYFSVKFAKCLRTPFLHNPSGDCFYFATLPWRTNNFFFSTHCLMYKKSNSFVYKFVFNCQVFEITPSGCTLWN